MRQRVNAKQHNSKMCFVCGLKNAFGLHAFFYELENDEILCIFTGKEEHQGYPGRMHGGVISAILDETIGRAITIREKDTWGVTVELSIRFRKPLPLGEELRAVGRIVKDTSRMFEGTGEILLKDGTVAVEGCGKYIKLPLEKIADFDAEAQEWKVVPAQDDPMEVVF